MNFSGKHTKNSKDMHRVVPRGTCSLTACSPSTGQNRQETSHVRVLFPDNVPTSAFNERGHCKDVLLPITNPRHKFITMVLTCTSFFILVFAAILAVIGKTGYIIKKEKLQPAKLKRQVLILLHVPKWYLRGDTKFFFSCKMFISLHTLKVVVRFARLQDLSLTSVTQNIGCFSKLLQSERCQGEWTIPDDHKVAAQSQVPAQLSQY